MNQLHSSATPLGPSDHRQGELWYPREEASVSWVLIMFNSCSTQLHFAHEESEVHGVYLTCLASSLQVQQDRGSSPKTLSCHTVLPAGTVCSQIILASQLCFSPYCVMCSQLLNLSVSQLRSLRALDTVMQVNFAKHMLRPLGRAW